MPFFLTPTRTSHPATRCPATPWRRMALAAGLGLGMALAGTAQAGGKPPQDSDPTYTASLLLACQTLAAANDTTLTSVNALTTGQAEAFLRLRQNQEVLGRLVPPLQSNEVWEELALASLVARMQRQAGEVARQETVLHKVDATRRLLRQQLAEAIESAEGVNAILIKEGATPAQLVAGGMLRMLLQRIALSNAEFLVLEGISPESVFLLGKDPKTLAEILTGLREGSAELRLTKPKSSALQSRLTDLAALHEQVRASTGVLLSNLEGALALREAHAGLSADNAQLSSTLNSICMNPIGFPRHRSKDAR